MQATSELRNHWEVPPLGTVDEFLGSFLCLRHIWWLRHPWARGHPANMDGFHSSLDDLTDWIQDSDVFVCWHRFRKQPTNQNHSVLVFPIPSSTGPATMIYFSGVFFFLLRISFGLFPTYQPGKDCWTGPFWKRCGEEMWRCHDNCLNFMILFNAWTCAFFSPGFREKSPKLLLVSTNGAICLDVASTSKRKWRFRLESPCRPQPKNGDVFLVLLETRFRNVCDAGRNASYAKCCDLVQCVKGNDCHEMSIPHLLVAFLAFFTLRGGEAAWK